MDQPESEGVRLLSFDGGDIRAVSQLLILDEFMRRIEWDRKSDTRILPCDYFHMMAGVGTGGIIVMLLAVLRMGIEEAIDEFINLWNVVFADATLNPMARSTKLEAAFKDLLKRKGLSENRKLYSGTEGDSNCNAFVCAVPESNLGMCEKFRSYKSRETSTNPTIIEAIKATCAIPTLFTPISIESVGCHVSYVTGAYNFNNPAWETIKEACESFGQRRLVACMLSLGCGQRPIARLSRENGEMVMDLISDIASDGELVDRDLAWRIGKSNVYYRFSVDRILKSDGTSALGLTEDITSCTKVFLEHAVTAEKVNQCTKASERLGRVTLTDIAGLNEPRPTTTYGLPSLSAFFVERPGLIKKMADCLFRVGPPVQRRIVISGLGGIGKTQITISFLHQFLSRFRHVLFIDASSVQSLESGIVAKVKSLGITYSRASASEALEVLANHDHEITRDWAIIYDNVDNRDINIADYFPQCSFGTIVITTRNPNLGNLAPQSHLKLDVMPEDEAIEVLLRSAFEASHLITEEDENRAREIAKELGCLPVALVQAGYFIKIHDCMHDYQQRLKKRRPDILSRPAQDQLDPHYHGVYATLNVTWPHLSPRAQNFMSVLGFVNYTGFPIVLLYRAADRGFLFEPFNLMDRPALFQQTVRLLCATFRPGEGSDTQDIDDLVAELERYSLVTRTMTFMITTLRLHPLVHSWTHDRLSQGEKEVYRAAAVRLLVCGTDYDDQDLYEFIYPHVNLASDRLDGLHVNDQAGLAAVLAHHGDLTVAIELWKGVQRKTLALYGRNDVRSGEADLQLARLYWRSGDWEVAADLEKGVVDIRKQTLGPRHPMTMKAVVQRAGGMAHEYRKRANSASTLRGALKFWEEQPGDCRETILLIKEELASCSDRQERINLCTEALQARMKRSGPDHHATVGAMENLAHAYSYYADPFSSFSQVYNIQNKQKARMSATDTWISVVAARTNKRGAEHPDTLNAMECLALSYYLHDRDKCVALLGTVVELRKTTQGPCHPKTLNAMQSLARVYGSKDYAASVDQWKEVLHFTREVKGPSHEDTLSVMKSLARAYEESKQYTELKPLWKEILRFTQKVKGSSHDDTLSALNSLLGVYYISINHAELALVFKEILHFTQRGKLHENALLAMKSLAREYKHYANSQELWREILHFTLKVEGPRHENTLSAMESLARAYGQSREYDKSEVQWKELLHLLREVRGRNHKDTLSAMKSLARMYVQSAQYRNSADLWKEILHLTQELHGTSHEDTLWAMTVLARMYDQSGQYAESAEQWKEIVRIRKDFNKPSHCLTLASMGCLAEMSMKCGRHTEAEALLLDAINQAPSKMVVESSLSRNPW